MVYDMLCRGRNALKKGGCQASAIAHVPRCPAAAVNTPHLLPVAAAGVNTGNGTRNTTLQDICFKPFGHTCALQSVLQYWQMDKRMYVKEQAKDPSDPRMTPEFCFSHWYTQCRSTYEVCVTAKGPLLRPLPFMKTQLVVQRGDSRPLENSICTHFGAVGLKWLIIYL